MLAVGISVKVKIVLFVLVSLEVDNSLKRAIPSFLFTTSDFLQDKRRKEKTYPVTFGSVYLSANKLDDLSDPVKLQLVPEPCESGPFSTGAELKKRNVRVQSFDWGPPSNTMQAICYPSNYNTSSTNSHAYKLPRIRSKTWDGSMPIKTDKWGIPFGSGLHRAVLEKRAHQVRLLISFGMAVDKRDAVGRTPSMLTAWLDSDVLSIRILRMLIRANADLNMKDYSGRSLLSHACIQGRVILVERLLREDTLEKNCPDVNGDSPLNLAAMNGFVDIVAMLVKALKRDGLNSDVRNLQGCTALLLATQNGHYRCAQILLEDGRASLSSRDNKHFMNPTDWARHSHLEHQREIKSRLSVVFGRADFQEMNDHTKLPRLSSLPRKHIPPYHSVADEMENISVLKDKQASLIDLIDSFEQKENEDNDYDTPNTMHRTFSSPGTEMSDDIETCLLEDPKMCATPITSELANIFKLYEQQMFIRRPQPIPEAEEPVEIQEDTKKAGRAMVRRQSTMNLMNLVLGKKKSLMQMSTSADK